MQNQLGLHEPRLWILQESCVCDSCERVYTQRDVL